MLRGRPRNALGHRPEPEVLPLPAETSREAQKCCAWQHQGGGPRYALGQPSRGLPLPAETSREAQKCCAWQHRGQGGPRNALGHCPEPEVLPLPAETSREAQARLESAAPGSIEGGGPRNALGHRPEPEVLPLPAETSREAPKCCAWQHRGGGPRNALGHRANPEVLPLPAETSRIKGGGPETRSGTVQSLKCCPCQQKRAARLKSAAPGRHRGGQGRGEQKRAAKLESAAPGSIEGGGARNALGHRPEPEVLPLPAETSREAQKCCAWQHPGGGPETRSGMCVRVSEEVNVGMCVRVIGVCVRFVSTYVCVCV